MYDTCLCTCLHVCLVLSVKRQLVSVCSSHRPILDFLTTGVPSDYDGAIRMLQDVRGTDAHMSGSAHSPWIVHCSAGVGRTGTFIGIDIGMKLLDVFGQVNIIDVIRNMRADRGQSVQSIQQADFMLHVLQRYAHQWNTEHRSQAATPIEPSPAVDISSPEALMVRNDNYIVVDAEEEDELPPPPVKAGHSSEDEYEDESDRGSIHSLEEFLALVESSDTDWTLVRWARSLRAWRVCAGGPSIRWELIVACYRCAF